MVGATLATAGGAGRRVRVVRITRSNSSGSWQRLAKLLAEIARLKRWQFGRSSERLDATLAQLQLASDDLQSAPPPTAEPAEETVSAEDST